MYAENEKEIAKAKIKYFRILPPKTVDENGKSVKAREQDYNPGAILELRPGDIEKRLIPFLNNMQYWDYQKPFDYSEWLKMQKPITFTEDGQYELKYNGGDKILIGNWIKYKILELFAKRKAPWDNRGQIINNCTLLLELIKNGFIKSRNFPTENLSMYSEEEIIDFIKKNCCFKGAEDAQIYPLIYDDENFFSKARIFSGTQELYSCKYNEELYVPYRKNETWNLNENLELLLGMMNQSFYEMLIQNAEEIQGSKKDWLFEEEYKNRIKILRNRFYNDRIYYQAIDDNMATEKILELRKLGYNISFDPYNINDSYPNGNIKYFSVEFHGNEWIKKKSTIEQFADELTDEEARKIFPEDFYLGRAYYQVRERRAM